MKITRLRAIAAGLLLTFGITGITGCSSAVSANSDTKPAAVDTKAVYRTLDEIKSSGTVNIGVFSDKNPFGYVDENGEYQGYDVILRRAHRQGSRR